MRTSSVVLSIICVLLTTIAASAQEEVWIPAAASNPGFHGTRWTTDLWLASRVLDAPIEVSAAFLPEPGGTVDPLETTIQIEAAAQVEISDAVATLFGENRPGAIRLRSNRPFFAMSRTANDGGELGSFGQGIPAFAVGDASDRWNLVGASNVPGASGVRTNLGIVNVGDEVASATIMMRDSQTLDILGSTTVEIGPQGWYQTDVFSLVGIGDRESELADVAIFAPEAEVLSYLSRVENRSGDGTFVAPDGQPYIRVLSRTWFVEATLTYSGSTAVTSFSYTTAEGPVIVDSPASGFTTGVLQLWAPNTFCVRAEGEHGPEPGTIEFEIRHRPEDDPVWAATRRKIAWGAVSGVTPLDESRCIELD